MTPREATLMRLATDDIIDIANGRGLSLKALSGAVWITQAHDGRDIILEAGDVFTLDRHGLAVVSALKPATVTVTAKTGQGARILRRGTRGEGLGDHT